MEAEAQTSVFLARSAVPSGVQTHTFSGGIWLEKLKHWAQRTKSLGRVQITSDVTSLKRPSAALEKKISASVRKVLAAVIDGARYTTTAEIKKVTGSGTKGSKKGAHGDGTTRNC